ncbi:uncharacterized protein K441DRAFT_664376 [Cenococcum geophilum 1.58]|uniref:uncharacterized protein n=1 Tax=Cenococcum geophilum 1.58 TaxID=794803 RepID=UPI00358EF69F|nr:hypothetical protein K441DRAFT_664376 [Cenococcum geophilum 1.58]
MSSFMSSFLRPWAFYFSQPRPLKNDPTGNPSHTNSDHNHYLSRADLYQGPIDVAPTDMPDLYDILLSDIDEEALHNEISTALGSAYLSETPHLTSPLATVDGIVFSKHHRVLFPLVVRLPGKTSRSYVIHFLYDSGSPFTFLSQEACDKLFGTNAVPSQFSIQINGDRTNVNPPNASSHFEHVNLLGVDFCVLAGIKVIIDYVKKTATMHFGQWE